MKKILYLASVNNVENPTVEEAEREAPGSIYPGDSVGYEMFVGRHSGRPDERGPWMVNLTWPYEAKTKIDASGVDEGTADLLYGLVRALRPRVVLETGTHKGRSTQAISSALVENDQGFMFTVDMDDYGCLNDALSDDEKGRVTRILGRSPGVFDHEPLKDLEKIDFAFLDGDHSGDVFRAELEWIDAHRDTTCYVVIDNSLDEGWNEVREVLNSYNEYPRISLETMCGLDMVCMLGPIRDRVNGEVSSGREQEPVEAEE